MMFLVPGKFLAARDLEARDLAATEWLSPSIRQVDQRLIIRPHCGGCVKRKRFYFVDAMGWAREYSLRIQAVLSKPNSPCPRVISTAGFGVVGPFGPRTGSSSGILPGNSCG
jgi:hypothetical protein